MVNIRTDMGTFGSGGALGAPAQAASMTAESATALTAAGAQTETATLTDAISGGSGQTGGAFNESGDRDAAISLINRNKVRIAEHRTILAAAVVRVGELDVKQLLIVTRLKEIENMLENIGLVAKN